MTAEGCLTVEYQLGVERTIKALISQDDEIQQRKQQGQTEKQHFNNLDSIA